MNGLSDLFAALRLRAAVAIRPAVLAAMVTALAAPAAPASASPFIAGIGRVSPVLAWEDFCRSEPGECAVGAAEPSTVALTARMRRLIRTVNRQVNREIRPITDQEHWGVIDRWSFPDDGAGDCEDYQLLKRKRLAEAGLPRRAMRMTAVLDEHGEGHAVLMIRTNRGDYILDNKRMAVRRWDRTGYVFLKREGDDGRTWVRLDPNAPGSPMIAMGSR